MASIDNGMGPIRTGSVGNTQGTSQTDGPGKSGKVGGGLISGESSLPNLSDLMMRTGNAPLTLRQFETSSRDTPQVQDRLSTVDTMSAEDLGKAIATLLSSIRDPDALAKMMIEFSSMARQNALDSRLQAREQARGELMAQAGETREAAAKMLTAAIVSFAFAVVSAVISVASAVVSLGQVGKSAKATKEATQTQKISDNIKGKGLDDLATKAKLDHVAGDLTAKGGRALRTADVYSQIGQALAGLSNAAGALGAGDLNSKSKIDEAEGQELGAAAQESQAKADMAKQFMDELQELIRSAIQFLQQMAQAETDMMATASRL